MDINKNSNENISIDLNASRNLKCELNKNKVAPYSATNRDISKANTIGKEK